MGKLELKLSKKQYQVMLDRMMRDKPDVAEQSSVVNQMGIPDAGVNLGNVPSQPMGMMPTEDVGMPPVGIQQQAMPATPVTMPPSPQVSLPNPQPSIGEQIAKAEQAWMEIKDTVGEQLWGKLFKTLPDTKGIKNPAAYFIASTVKFMQNPAAIQDVRVKDFIGGIVDQLPENEIENEPDMTNNIAFNTFK